MYCRLTSYLGCVYTRRDPFGTDTDKPCFTRDLADSLQIDSSIRYHMGSFVKVIQFGTASLQGDSETA